MKKAYEGKTLTTKQFERFFRKHLKQQKNALAYYERSGDPSCVTELMLIESSKNDIAISKKALELVKENAELKMKLADQAVSDLGGTVEIVANLQCENTKSKFLLKLLKRYLHCWTSANGFHWLGLNERNAFLGESKVDVDDFSTWSVDCFTIGEWKAIVEWLSEEDKEGV